MKAIVKARICNPYTCARTAQSARVVALIGLFIAIFLFQPLSRSLMAQTTTSTIEGTVTDANGAFKLTDVPAGSYDVKVWHETLGEATVKVTVAAGAEAKADFELAGK